MKVKSFDNYRAPKRRPWIAAVVGVLMLVGIGMLVRGCVQHVGDYRTRRAVAKAELAALAPSVAGEAEGVPAAVTTDPATAAELADGIKLADEMIAADELGMARDSLLTLLPQAQGNARITEMIETKLGRANTELVLSPRRMAGKVDYVVKRGDTVQKIANAHGSTAELIKVSNGLKNANLIKVGDRIRVLPAVFTLHASKSRHDLLVLMDGAFFKRYPVGTGRFGKTPPGSFLVRDKIVNPPWWRPDGRQIAFGEKENVLGTRWMSLRATGETPKVRGYGIHGTWDDDSVGKESSAGCLRMLNADVEELFIYIGGGTSVTIVE
jgi:lipoprotein-anchoring transpeptidase ErfK/SrfK